MTVLLLAGSGEARALAAQLHTRGVPVVASLAGATRAPLDLGVDTRTGGFGGVEGLRRFLRAHQIRAVIDATHPFAAQMTAHAAGATRAAGVPHLVLQRLGWQPEAGDRWHWVDALEDAAALIPDRATVFLGTGRQSLGALSGLSPRRVLARVIDPPDRPFPFAGGRFVVGTPPFTVEEERSFFVAEGVDWLVVKNAGGAASFSKLEAARALGLPVVIQRRPVLPAGVTKVETVEEALAWVGDLGLCT